MELLQFYTRMSLLLSIFICKLAQIDATPTYYDLDSYENSYDPNYHHRSYDSGSGNSYTLTYGKPLTGDHLDKLDTGYYYVDNGYIAPVPSSSASSQRSLTPYSDDVLSDGYRIAPVARYRRTRTKRKKLFVPNFFG
ncbi:uncharacterized protein LOC117784407 [Drosophila innubila]|uniref:uncharacterized protein LOC117784407 n=1 Tax=Drosophila innubila TaxID=198719 RepID=UPI00148D11A0|nr:uncharacterized protein LOC117784407 [Drosophila innubila]